MLNNSNNTSTGQDPEGKVVAIPVAGMPAITMEPLGANQVWDSGIMPYNGANTIDYQIFSDVSGMFKVEFYVDDQKLPFMPTPGSYNPDIVQSFQSAFNSKGTAVRFIYTNGDQPQTVFLFAVNFGQGSQETQQSAPTPISDTQKASVVKAMIQGKENAAGTRKEFTGTTKGSKFGVDAHIVNDVPIKVEVSNPTAAPEPTDVSDLAKNDTLVTGVNAIVQALNGLATDDKLTSILNKIITAPSTEAKQDAGNTLLTEIRNKIASDPATAGKQDSANTALANILTKLPASPATEGKQDATNTALNNILNKLIAAPATETTLAAILNKLIAAPATEAKQDAGNSSLSAINTKLGATVNVAVQNTDYAKEGTDITGAAMPAGGLGIRGWLSAIYKKLTDGIGVFSSISISGGYPLKYKVQPSGANGNFAVIKGSEGVIGTMIINNTSATTVTMLLYDKSTLPVSGDNPAMVIPIPAGTTIPIRFEGGMHFDNGIGIGFFVGTSLLNIVSLLLTAITAGNVTVNINYK